MCERDFFTFVLLTLVDMYESFEGLLDSKGIIVGFNDCLFLSVSKSVNKEYEEYVLSVGDFDERIFLDDEAHVEIGTPAKSYTFAEVDEQQR